jgi:hypothetical protein
VGTSGPDPAFSASQERFRFQILWDFGICDINNEISWGWDVILYNIFSVPVFGLGLTGS